ncbi:conserved hypothetical protein [Ferrimonas balearica DSM 9799]|uniref:Uncharacterized protein n=1 Tax=Ferrimonas balearica (strain DSM 9799 / CCM 4581 / KCTC 23876 / PAT) TaxID=550540 RepID=E1STJ1_FERBD|nr:hypothetical protein [Ferrimonas balearica]ADN75124.1 conserved hypothetical protein [Ferrimonas balearica DSM 9799]
MMAEQHKMRWFSVSDLTTLVAGLAVIYTVWAQHNESMANLRQTQAMLSKYEAQLDLAIANDGNVLKTYQNNLRAISKAMSKEERALLEQLLAVDASVARQ